MIDLTRWQLMLLGWSSRLFSWPFQTSSLLMSFWLRGGGDVMAGRQYRRWDRARATTSSTPSADKH
jgi:hypothetical protein